MNDKDRDLWHGALAVGLLTAFLAFATGWWGLASLLDQDFYLPAQVGTLRRLFIGIACIVFALGSLRVFFHAWKSMNEVEKKYR